MKKQTQNATSRIQESDSVMPSSNNNWHKAGKFGFWIAIFTSLLTIISFALALTALPKSGAYCLESCIDYPYLDIAAFYPGDYYWMVPASVLMLFFVMLVSSIYHYAPNDKKLFSQISYSFALISAMILLVDYFIQLVVIQPSILSGQTDGISLLTQYNPHGIFIALEELGYLLMSIAFLFLALVFDGSTRIERSIRIVFIVNFLGAIFSYTILSFIWGLNLEYQFEIIIITLNWLTLIIIGFLTASLFKQKL